MVGPSLLFLFCVLLVTEPGATQEALDLHRQTPCEAASSLQPFLILAIGCLVVLVLGIRPRASYMLSTIS